ncbi:MAG: cofactor-independent phosphoglycerate mutase [Dethiobacteria bacterium]
MKYAVVLGDGMPDERLEELGGKTPLQYARTPRLDQLARCGEVGLARTVPPGMPAGSDVANLAVLGYDPEKYYTGRSPLEAVAMGVELAADDLALRCNLVTLSEEEPYEERRMLDYSAGEISTAEAGELLITVRQKLGSGTFHFHAGVSYRHLLVWRGGADGFRLTPPHDITGQKIAAYLPRGKNSPLLSKFMQTSSTFLPDHPVNKKRRARGLQPANSIWLWGEGRKPHLDSFAVKYGLAGAVVSAVDLIKGLGMLAGLKVVEVPGATGNMHTNFKGKARGALKALQEGCDFVFIHIEAPDEAGHQGEFKVKVQAIEAIEDQVIGEILSGLEEFQDYKLMVLADHPTPVRLRTHTADPVPYCIYRKGDSLKNPQGAFNESFAAQGKYIARGYTLMDHFLAR